MSVTFESPELLIAILPAVAFLFFAARKTVTSLPRSSRWISFSLRLAILLSLLLALAEARLETRTRKFQVFFLADRSSSVPDELKTWSLDWIRSRSAFMKDEDRAGFIVFGEEASLQETLGERLEVRSIQTPLNGQRTSIENALELAIGTYDERGGKRAILLTDGNETDGNAVETARRARTRGISVDVLPLVHRTDSEILVEKLISPKRVRRGEPFEVKTVLRSAGIAHAKINLFRDGVLIATKEAPLDPGTNVLVLPQTLSDPGFHRFEAVVESPEDTRSTNNRGVSFCSVQGRPHLLHLPGEPEVPLPFLEAARNQGLEVTTLRPQELPLQPADLQNFQGILLTNVSASSFSPTQMRVLQAFVADLGGGLIALGGDQSFAAGGYQGTPLEETLPVFMEAGQDRVLPKGALAVCLHTCEFPDGNRWAKEISKAALNVLSSRDLFGVISFDPRGGGDTWSIPLQPAETKRELFSSLEGLNPGDMPSFNPSLQLAMNGLKEVNAAVKHLVIISDGDPSPPHPQLLEAFLSEKITISTVCINPHGDRDVEVMRDLAQRGRGNSYFVKNVEELPMIFVREASTVRKPAIDETPFRPRIASPSPVLDGLPLDTMPELLGHVLTTKKLNAQTPLVTPKGDPLLALGRHGLGKTAAFTSDASSRWGRSWISWEGYAKFFYQLVLFCLRTEDTPFQLEVETTGRTARILLDAVTPEGELVTDLNGRATVLGPDLKSFEAPLRQTEPGRYEAVTPIEAEGSHLVRLDFQRRNSAGEEIHGGLTSGFSPPIAPEFLDLRSDEGLLREIAMAGGGRLLDGTEDVFSPEGIEAQEPRELWPLLVAAAALLLPLDVFFRKVIPNWDKAFSHFRRKEEQTVPSPTIESVGPDPPEPRGDAPSPAPPTSQDKSEVSQRLLAAKQKAASRLRRTRSSRQRSGETDREHEER